jgi:hypothetical protein
MTNLNEMDKSGSFYNDDFINIQNNIANLQQEINNQEESINRDGLYLNYDENSYNNKLRGEKNNESRHSEKNLNKNYNNSRNENENENENENQYQYKFQSQYKNQYQQDSFQNTSKKIKNNNEYQSDANYGYTNNDSKYDVNTSKKSYGGRSKNTYDIDYNDTFSKKQLNFPEISKVNQNSQFNYVNLTNREMNQKNLNESQSNNYLNNVNNTSKSNDESNKFVNQIMEKDKTIFEYSKLLKESERNFEKSKIHISEKDELIYKLKDEIKELKFKIRNGGNLIEKKEEELEKYKRHTEEKFMNLNREKALFEEKYKDLAKLFENNHSDFQNTVFEYKKLENNLDKLKNQLIEKDDIIKGNERFIDELKREIKQIPILKKESFDLEQTIKILTKELQGEKNLNEKIIQSTNDSEKKLAIIIEETKHGKEIMNNYLKQNYELENLKKELEYKDNEIQNNNERYKTLMKENDNFVQFFTNELTDFNCLIENVNYYKTGIIGGNTNLNNSNQNVFSEKFSLKYEILNKNFDTLKKKYVENYNQNSLIINKFEKSFEEIERINAGLTNERDEFVKEISILKETIKEYRGKINETNDDNDKINENFRNLRDNYIKLKTNFEELQEKNNTLCQETHLFLINCKDKLKEKYPEIDKVVRKDKDENHNSIESKKIYLNL